MEPREREREIAGEKGEGERGKVEVSRGGRGEWRETGMEVRGRKDREKGEKCRSGD